VFKVKIEKKEMKVVEIGLGKIKKNLKQLKPNIKMLI